MCLPYTAQGVATDRDKEISGCAERAGESRRDKQGLIDGAAHGGDAADFVDRRADDGEVEPVLAADIAVEYLADVKTEIHIGHGQIAGGTREAHFSDAPARSDGGGERRLARASPILYREYGENAVADQFQNIAPLFINRGNDRAGIIVEQRNNLSGSGRVADPRVAAQDR